MSHQGEPRQPRKTVQRLMPARLLLGLAIIAAIIHFVDHTPLRIIIPSLLLTVLIIFLIRRWQRKSGMFK